MKLAGLPCHAGDRGVCLTFQLCGVRYRHIWRWLRRCGCIKTFIHPAISIHPLLSMSSWWGLMCAHVLGQVIIAHKNSGAQCTAELLGSSVRLQVALQFIGAREPLPTEKPVADKWPVPAVPAKVRLQMGGFSIGFATARDVAVMHVLPPAVISALTQLFCMDTVRAAAHCLTCASGRGAALGLGPGRGRRLLWFFQGESFLLQHFRSQWFHLEAVLSEEVRWMCSWSMLSWRQSAELWVGPIGP